MHEPPSRRMGLLTPPGFQKQIPSYFSAKQVCYTSRYEVDEFPGTIIRCHYWFIIAQFNAYTCLAGGRPGGGLVCPGGPPPDTCPGGVALSGGCAGGVRGGPPGTPPEQRTPPPDKAYLDFCGRGCRSARRFFPRLSLFLKHFVLPVRVCFSARSAPSSIPHGTVFSYLRLCVLPGTPNV